MTNSLYPKQDRVVKLLQFIANKGRQECLLFLQAIKEEDTHMGHKELYQKILQDGSQYMSHGKSEYCM